MGSRGREEVGSCGGEEWVGWVAGGKGVCGWWRGGGQLWWRGYLGGGELCRSEQLWWVVEMVECTLQKQVCYFSKVFCYYNSARLSFTTQIDVKGFMQYGS